MEKSIRSTDILKQYPNMPVDTVTHIMNFMTSGHGVFIGNIKVSVVLSVGKWLDKKHVHIHQQQQMLAEWQSTKER